MRTRELKEVQQGVLGDSAGMPLSYQGLVHVLPAWRSCLLTSCAPTSPLPLPPASDGTEYVAPAAAGPEHSTPLAAQKTPAPGLLELQVGQQAGCAGPACAWQAARAPGHGVAAL